MLSCMFLKLELGRSASEAGIPAAAAMFLEEPLRRHFFVSDWRSLSTADSFLFFCRASAFLRSIRLWKATAQEEVLADFPEHTLRPVVGFRLVNFACCRCRFVVVEQNYQTGCRSPLAATIDGSIYQLRCYELSIAPDAPKPVSVVV